jgi:threonylcarbamoyladenosine tRNA methylthiotransferase MtaB
MKPSPKAAFYTLGCKVNQNETEALAALFRERGYQVVDWGEPADVYVINTCTVTHLADRKSRQFIRQAVKKNPQAKVVVTGCYAQASPQEVAGLPGVDLVVGNRDKGRIVDLLAEAEKGKKGERPPVVISNLGENRDFKDIKATETTNRARAYLKVQEGCEQFCTYCIIPYARGPVRSRPLENTVKAAQKLIEDGFREVVLTGIHLGAYGQDLEKSINLEHLLKRLLTLSSSVRWRLSSLEPTEVTEGLIELLAEHPNFCPHLHLPLQSAHDEILQAMNRPYTVQQYMDVVERVRLVLPDICLTTDIMVGFPGETEEHFQVFPGVLKKIGFSDLHVFKYSPRKGTPAAGYPRQVPPAVKTQRSSVLLALATELAERYASRFLGRRMGVLAETHLGQDLWEGHSENYLRVRFKKKGVKRGEIIPLTLQKVSGKNCFGKPVNE